MATPASSVSKPLIGITTDYLEPKGARSHTKLNAGYVDAVVTGGGVPILIPPFTKDNFDDLDRYLDMVSGVILTGGSDLDPRSYGRSSVSSVVQMANRRQTSERILLEKIVNRKMPVLGIGAGMQLLNIYFGGNLFVHLPTDNPKAMQHFDPTGSAHRHMVLVEKGSTLEDIYGSLELRVNSEHHQAVDKLGKRLRVAVKSPDGVIEAFEATDDTWFCIGVQWHPEADTRSALDCQIFDCLVQAAYRYTEPALAVA